MCKNKSNIYSALIIKKYIYKKYIYKKYIKRYVNLINYGLGLIKRSEGGYSACKTKRTM